MEPEPEPKHLAGAGAMMFRLWLRLRLPAPVIHGISMLQIKISFHKSISINKICSINVQDLDDISLLAAAATLALRMFNFIS